MMSNMTKTNALLPNVQTALMNVAPLDVHLTVMTVLLNAALTGVPLTVKAVNLDVVLTDVLERAMIVLLNVERTDVHLQTVGATMGVNQYSKLGDLSKSL